MRTRGVWAAAFLLSSAVASACVAESMTGDSEQNRVQRGIEISPVALDMTGRDPALVGLGSYVVNAQGGCNDCHSCPSYVPGQNPYMGGSGATNAANYLAGGTPFGPELRAPNLTPNALGLPGGLEYGEFEEAMRAGHDPDDPDEILQVMPWPVYRNMGDRDLRAIYEYLSAIPHAEPGVCAGAGE